MVPHACYCIGHMCGIIVAKLGALADLPEPCLVHALMYLCDLDDLLRFAATNSAARALLHAYWSELRPNGEAQRRAFVDRMALWRSVARSSYFTYEQRIAPPQPEISSQTTVTTTTWETNLLQNHRVNVNVLDGRPSGRAFVTAVWVSGDWMNEGDCAEGRRLDIDAGGMRVLRIDADNARLDRAPDGRLDLMRYIRRMPANWWGWGHFILYNFSGADITVTATMATTAAAEEVDFGATEEWVMDVPSRSERVAASDVVVRVPVPDCGLAVEHITVQLLDQAGRPLLLPCEVARFTLNAKWSCDTSPPHLPPQQRFVLEGTWTNDISGWACRVAGGYRLPMERLCFIRLDKVKLEVRFSSPPPTGAMISVCTSGHNIIRTAGGCMGLAFAI